MAMGAWTRPHAHFPVTACVYRAMECSERTVRRIALLPKAGTKGRADLGQKMAFGLSMVLMSHISRKSASSGCYFKCVYRMYGKKITQCMLVRS